MKRVLFVVFLCLFSFVFCGEKTFQAPQCKRDWSEENFSEENGEMFIIGPDGRKIPITVMEGRQ